MKHPLVALLVVALLAAPASTRAQEVCGGIAGIPCTDPGEFCQLPDGECCCDFQGVCAEIPQACPLLYVPVCGCDGVTYDNRCTASMAAVSVAHACACEAGGPEVPLTHFTGEYLFWGAVPGALAYNVYLRDVDFVQPVFAGHCLYSAVAQESVLFQGSPTPGQLWMLQVTALSPSEGSMGLTSGCEPRTPAAPCRCTLPANAGPCAAAVPRWFHNFQTGQCELFIWGGCGGNANNFPTEAECAAACLDPCDLPADVGPCDGVCPRWFFDPATGHCETFIWGCCGGNANNFPTQQDCRRACGDICLLPPDPGPCDGVCPRWFFDPATGQCEMFVWGCCGGNANNFPTEAECEARCPGPGSR